MLNYCCCICITFSVIVELNPFSIFIMTPTTKDHYNRTNYSDETQTIFINNVLIEPKIKINLILFIIIFIPLQ